MKAGPGHWLIDCFIWSHHHHIVILLIRPAITGYLITCIKTRIDLRSDETFVQYLHLNPKLRLKNYFLGRVKVKKGLNVNKIKNLISKSENKIWNQPLGLHRFHLWMVPYRSLRLVGHLSVDRGPLFLLAPESTDDSVTTKLSPCNSCFTRQDHRHWTDGSHENHEQPEAEQLAVG